MKKQNKGFQAVAVEPGKKGFISLSSEPLAKKPIALRLPLSLDELVRRLAAEQGVSAGEWIRAAIAAHLKEMCEKASPPTNAGLDSDE
ncbi:MAG: ribbon-helix-helix domain-containing protein [Oscillatoria princeps RMCB-10]|jgi:hypothetical protein|nr:ribbon-helix-helix domain-containing protein [Oscillatoria princeps RMCB-10]